MIYPRKFGFRSILAPCSQEDLAEIENEFNSSLPLDYRQFLETWNGGTFTEFDSPGFFLNDKFVIVGLLFGAGPVQCDVHLLSSETRQGYDFDERVPSNFLAIGAGIQAQFACISMFGQNTGKIFYWDPGVPAEENGNKQTEEHLHLVAENFAEFWQLLSSTETARSDNTFGNWQDNCVLDQSGVALARGLTGTPFPTSQFWQIRAILA